MTRQPISRLLHAVRILDAPHAPAAEDPSLEVTRYLARDLVRRLRAVDGTIPDASPVLLAEGARACGDLATLIACNPALLPSDEALSAARAAAAAARDLLSRTEARISSSAVGWPDYPVRDARGAIWRADLAVRQVEETRAAGEARPEGTPDT
jgi:hypothetical protein